MLTGDENIVDIDFQVVWNITDAQQFLFNLQDPKETIRAVSESAMREIIARSNLSPILNKDRGAITAELKKLIQDTLDIYGSDSDGNVTGSGINIIRVNLLGANPPREVIDAFVKCKRQNKHVILLKNRQMHTQIEWLLKQGVRQLS